MSKQLTQTELTRLAWLTALRTQGDRQCRNRWKMYDRVCAFGLLAEVHGLPKVNDPWSLAGLSGVQAAQIMRMNDGIGYRALSFAEIADVVASWFPSNTEQPQ